MRLPIIASAQDIGKNIYNSFNMGYELPSMLTGSERTNNYDYKQNPKSIGGALTFGGLASAGAVTGAALGAFSDGGSMIEGAAIGAGVGLAALPAIGLATRGVTSANKSLFKNNKVGFAASSLGYGSIGATLGSQFGPMGTVVGGVLGAGIGNTASALPMKFLNKASKPLTKYGGTLAVAAGGMMLANTAIDAITGNDAMGATTGATLGIGGAVAMAPAAILGGGAAIQVGLGLSERAVQKGNAPSPLRNKIRTAMGKKPLEPKQINNLSDIKLSKTGKALLGGAALISGVVGAKNAFESSRMGTNTGEVFTATPRQPSFEEMNAGASGDLVFALNNLRRG